MDEIIGHERNKIQLDKIIKTGSIAHAYLFVGKSGIGKKLLATKFAKGIMCERVQGIDFCDECESCKLFGNTSDFKIITPTKDVIKVDEVREFCKELFLMPTNSNRKVFVIDDAECMNEQAQNALLKVLEEPPMYATIILISSNKEKLLNTIKSRIVEIQFDSLSNEEIEKIMKFHGVTDINEETFLYANGSAKKAFEISNDTTFEVSKELAKLLLTRDFLAVNRKFEEIKTDKKIKSEIFEILEKVMRIYHVKLKNEPNFDYKLIEAIEDAIQKIKRNANVDLTLDSLMVEVCKI